MRRLVVTWLAFASTACVGQLEEPDVSPPGALPREGVSAFACEADADWVGAAKALSDIPLDSASAQCVLACTPPSPAPCHRRRRRRYSAHRCRWCAPRARAERAR